MFADDTSLTPTAESSFEIEYKLGVETQDLVRCKQINIK